MQILGTILADDQQHNYCIRDSLYDVFATVVLTSDPKLAGDIVSAIVEDYTNSPLEFLALALLQQMTKALGFFAQSSRLNLRVKSLHQQLKTL